MNNNLWCINSEEERCIFVRLGVQFKPIYCMRELCVSQGDRNITAGMASHLNRVHAKMDLEGRAARNIRLGYLEGFPHRILTLEM